VLRHAGLEPTKRCPTPARSSEAGPAEDRARAAGRGQSARRGRAAELSRRLETIVSEREDVVEAIKKLRQAIQSLNREGRERLLAAFDVVNGQFQRLFTHLFGGGTAELQLIESKIRSKPASKSSPARRARSRRP
jgi:chromosome segregation protein